MLPIARIKPDNGYCFYFQDREEGQRFVAGRRIWVWPWWESWKHVKLGVFEVAIRRPVGGLAGSASLPEAMEHLFTTGDNHYCEVDAKFSIVVGGPEKGRESRLERATITCPPTNRVKDRVELSFFEGWARNHCKGAIARTLQECTFIALLEDSAIRRDVAARIRADARESLDSIGLMLVGGSVVIEPQEPKGVSATQDVLEKWQQFRRTLDVIELQRMKDGHDREQQEAEEGRKHEIKLEETAKAKAIEQAQLQKERDQEIARIRDEGEVSRKELENQRSRTIGDIQIQIDARDQELRLEKIRYDSQIREKELGKKAALEQEEERQRQVLLQLGRQEETEQARHALALQDLTQQRLDAEGESSRREAELLDVKKRLADAQVDQELRQGQVRAEVLKEETLARHADVIRLRELEFGALPHITELATKPLEKIGTVTVHMMGSPDGTASAGLGSVFTAVSALPLVKECMRFLREWGDDRTAERAPRQADADPDHRGDGAPR